MKHELYDAYITACKQTLKFLQLHKEFKNKRDDEWYRRLRLHRMSNGDYFAIDPQTNTPLRNRKGNKVILRVPEFKKAQHMYNHVTNNLEQIINGNFENAITKLKRQRIPERHRNLDLSNIESQITTGLNDLRLKNMVMKDLKNEYISYMDEINEFLFMVEEGTSRVSVDSHGNLVPVPIEPVTFDWLDDLKFILDNTNDLFITLKNNPSVKEFDADAILKEALGESQ